MRGHIRKYKLKTGGELCAAVVYQGKRFGRDGKRRDSYRWIRGFEMQNAAEKGLRKILTSIDEERTASLQSRTLPTTLTNG